MRRCSRIGFCPGTAAALLVALAAGALAAPEETQTAPSARAALARAAGWLWSRQGADGGWHSETYGLLKSGQAFTPFILSFLMVVPQDVAAAPEGGVERALGFIRARVNEAGALGMSDPDFLEYPNYATAFGLVCLVRADAPEDAALRTRMRDYLVSAQYREAQGFERTAYAYGGWGFGGVHPPGVSGHMDIAHTRHVLAALRAAGGVDAAVFERAQAFLALMQRQPDDPRTHPMPLWGEGEEDLDAASPPPFDGGFYFSPVVLDANKGRLASAPEGGRYWRSYATATCDGLLALRAAGAGPEDPRVLAARRWLLEHPALDYPAGVPRDQPIDWGAAIHYYHLYVRADAYADTGWPEGAAEALARLLITAQHADGSFQNRRTHLMKEDDPLLATALAVSALSRARESDQ